ncbi:MAG: hypothetical protein JWQ97_857 [Phenylobacterium sp.]|nr:hypothetical protein [Phenylobacterium sp.]
MGLEAQVKMAAAAGPAQTAPEAVVAVLRREIIAAPAGAYLGSEAELLVRLTVSSPTLRQAARLLEQQQLLTVERGNKGGYYGRRPDAGATARAVALYLEASGTPIAQVRETARPLMLEAAQLAARGSGDAARTNFVAALQAIEALPEACDCRELLKRDRILTGELLKLAGSPAIELFLLVIYRLGRLNEPRLRLFAARPDLAEAWRRHVIRFGRAILEGDAELAALFAVRGMELTRLWQTDFEGAETDAQIDTRDLNRTSGLRASVAQGAADGLRRAILSQPPGAFLGSEEELAARFKVSRHTLRQAAAMALHDGLLEIRRGVNGGYVGRRPNIDAVVQAAALYLELNGCSLRDLMAAAQSLASEASGLAAQSGTPDYQARLLGVRAQMEAVGGDADSSPAKSILRAEQSLMDLILELCENRATGLFVKSLYRHGATLPQPVRDSRDRIIRWRDARLRLIDELLERDGAAAMVICGRISHMLDEWLG